MSSPRLEPLSTAIARLRARLAQEERGFSLVEVLVALFVLFIALVALARTATVAFSDIGLTRQRQTANQIANGLVEEVRGLPYDAVKLGLSTDHLAGDPGIVSCSGTYYLGACPPAATAEKIVHTPGLPEMRPLVPHRGSVGPPDFPSTFSWSVYITEAAGTYRVTAIVSWSQAHRSGLRNSVDVETLIYSPDGCVDTATHPFAAPCQPYFYGNGVAGGGAFGVSGTVAGVDFDSMSATLLQASANMQVEQVSRVDGSVSLPAAASVVNGVQNSTGSSTSSTADNDPSTAAGIHARQTVGPAAPGLAAVDGGGNRLAVSLGGGPEGATTSTTSAGGANSCNLQLDGRPCGFGEGVESGGTAATLTLADGVGTAQLLSVGVTSTDTTAYARRYVPSADEGLVRERVDWVLPQILVGRLPSGVTAPSGWSGYWVRLSGFSASAQAESGLNTSAPTVAVAGTVEAWNGTGYSSVTVTPAGGEVPIVALDHQSTDDLGNTVQVQIGGTVSVNPSTVAETVSGTSTRTEAKATVGSPLIVNLTYRVVRNGAVQADLSLEFHAGQARATTTYRPAPTA